MRARVVLALGVLVLSAGCTSTLSGHPISGTDAGFVSDSAVNDMRTSLDMNTAPTDMEVPTDTAMPPDMSASVDMSVPTDMAMPPMDMAMPPMDMAMPPSDMGTPVDSGFDSGPHIDAGPSPGCGIAHATGKYTVNLMVGAEMRSFMVSVTDAYDATHPAPILFGVHGCGDTSMGAWYSLNLVTDGSGVEAAFGGRAVYVYPQGVSTPSCSTGWTLSHLDQDLAFMDAIRAYMESNYCVDSSGVMVIGLSYGAEFANRYACRRASEVIFSSPLAAGDAVPSPCTGSVPMWISWGTADPGISEGSFNGIRDFWNTNNGCSLTMSDPVPESPMCGSYRDCDSKPVIACRVEGGGHAQPSPNYGPALLAYYRRLIGEIPWP